ncbi:hypothetical protein CsatB_030810 [Cannabis sativa]
MSAFLKEADAWARDGRNERVGLLVELMREKSLDLEDVIETYLFQVANNNNSNWLIHWPAHSVDVHKVGSKINKISSKIATWTTELKDIGVLETSVLNNHDHQASSSHSSLENELRKVPSHVVDNHVVGFNNDIKELVALLTEKEKSHKHKVISVYGMGGLGKTTLTRKVYQHRKIKRHFDCYAWVSISQQCNRRDVWEGILFGFTSPTNEQRNHIKSLSDDELAKELHDFQMKWKCLVVLDDIWTTTTWDLLKNAFPITNQGDTLHSKILLTTRKKNVALHVDRRCLIHRAGPETKWAIGKKKFLGPYVRNNVVFFKISKKKLYNFKDEKKNLGPWLGGP